MAKGRSFEQKLAHLGEIARGPVSPEATDALRDTIQEKNSLLAARAAEIAANRSMDDLIPDLVAAFDRFMVQPDKQCAAKIAIVDALNKLGYQGRNLLLKGIRHVQMEPVWGDLADTAAPLRAGCAFALARMGDPDALFELTMMLFDKEKPARLAAANAIAYLGGEPSELILRVKIMAGDKEPEVIGECFAGLMEISPERSADFVGAYLDSEDPVIAEHAALALGQSRTAKAFEILRERWEDSLSSKCKEMLALPIALTRRDEAVDLLITAIGKERSATAAAVVAALGIYPDDNIRRRICMAVESRGDPSVSKAYEREFENG